MSEALDKLFDGATKLTGDDRVPSDIPEKWRPPKGVVPRSQEWYAWLAVYYADPELEEWRYVARRWKNWHEWHTAYIASPVWSVKRWARRMLDRFQCRLGKSHDHTCLNVHHSTYETVPYESIEDDLTTLCRECHESVTNADKERRHAKKTIDVIPHKTVRGLSDEQREEAGRVAGVQLQAHRAYRPDLPQRPTG